MEPSLQNTSRRALRLLNDARISKIGYLINHLFSQSIDLDIIQLLKAELHQFYLYVSHSPLALILISYTSDPDLSFLVIRHIRQHLQQNEESAFFYIPTVSDIIDDFDEHQGANGLEENLEWSELDEVIRHISGELIETRAPPDRLLDMVLR